VHMLAFCQVNVLNAYDENDDDDEQQQQQLSVAHLHDSPAYLILLLIHRSILRLTFAGFPIDIVRYTNLLTNLLTWSLRRPVIFYRLSSRTSVSLLQAL